METRKQVERFPLWLHPTGQWCKKHRGQFHYFGTDKDEALQLYVSTWDDIKAGRTPRPKSEETTVAALINHFLTAKRERVDAGEMTGRMWSEYYSTCEEIVEVFGRNRNVSDLRPDDFAQLRKAMSSRLGPVAMGNFIQRVRTVFKYGFDAELIAVPVRFGPGFAKPPRRVVRIQRADKGAKMIAPADIQKLIAEAGSPLDAMILLGINAGFGQTDCSELPLAALSRPGWIDFRRPKTGAPRRAPLWPETVAAIEQTLQSRPQPVNPEDTDLVFLTRFGRPFVRFTDPGNGKAGCRIDGIGQEFNKLVARLGLKINGGFYTLRHVHRTIADETKDHVAAGIVMGHVDEGIAAHYREHVSDERLEVVTNHIRNWLFGTKPNKNGQ